MEVRNCLLIAVYSVILLAQLAKVHSAGVICYMCDTDVTEGADAAIPKSNQQASDCASSDPAVLNKFKYQCDPDKTGCDTGFALSADNKTVTRTYRDCVSPVNKQQRGLDDGQCGFSAYPPGMQWICVCNGAICNVHNGFARLSNGTIMATVNGLLLPVNTMDVSKGVVPANANFMGPSPPPPTTTTATTRTAITGGPGGSAGSAGSGGSSDTATGQGDASGLLDASDPNAAPEVAARAGNVGANEGSQNSSATDLRTDVIISIWLLLLGSLLPLLNSLL